MRKDADIERLGRDLAGLKAELAEVETKLVAEREARAKAEGEIAGYQREIESLESAGFPIYMPFAQFSMGAILPCAHSTACC